MDRFAKELRTDLNHNIRIFIILHSCSITNENEECKVVSFYK
mgnify:CR=1 FL=1